MKRKGDIWAQICNTQALTRAHRAARRGKAHYREVKMVNEHEAQLVESIRQSLIDKTYSTSHYQVDERFDGRKLRVIHKLPYYPDRVVQHALISACSLAWERSFIRDTFQSIPGRGTHDARKRVREAVYKKPGLYALKFDISKYYPSVNGALLKEKVRKTIKCKDTLWLIDDIIDSCKGLPIGNYTSQFFGNIYLSDFDWWVKQTVKPRGYFRYCDDVVVIGNSAEECHAFRELLFSKLQDEYHLTIKNDWQVFPIDRRGLDFVGFVFKSSGVKLRRNIARNVAIKAKDIHKNHKRMTPYQIANGAGSYWGWCKHGQGRGLWEKHMTPPVRYRIAEAKVKIRELRCK